MAGGLAQAPRWLDLQRLRRSSGCQPRSTPSADAYHAICKLYGCAQKDAAVEALSSAAEEVRAAGNTGWIGTVFAQTVGYFTNKEFVE